MNQVMDVHFTTTDLPKPILPCIFFFFFNRCLNFSICKVQIFLLFFAVNGVLNPELPNRTIPMCRATNVQSPINFEDRHVLKCEPKPNDLVHLKQNVHSRNVINHKVMIPSNTVLYIILSQAVLAFFYYDLGFLFGNVSYCI